MLSILPTLPIGGPCLSEPVQAVLINGLDPGVNLDPAPSLHQEAPSCRTLVIPTTCGLAFADFVCWTEWEHEKASVNIVDALWTTLETVQVR
jgi:hypothetical protein